MKVIYTGNITLDAFLTIIQFIVMLFLPIIPLAILVVLDTKYVYEDWNNWKFKKGE